MPLLFSLLIGWSIYRRARRSIGRQLVRPRRLWIRTGILATIGVAFLLTSVTHLMLLEALAGGLIGGAVLAVFGLRHTKFESTPQANFYTPHTYIGLFVMALFIARVAYRLAAIYLSPGAHDAPGNPFYSYQRSPLTLFIFGVLLSYYVVFNLGILRWHRSSPPSEPGTPPHAAGDSTPVG